MEPKLIPFSSEHDASVFVTGLSILDDEGLHFEDAYEDSDGNWVVEVSKVY